MAEDVQALIEAVDVCFVVLMGTIVFFMQAGFAALEIGAARRQNSAAVLLKNFSDACYSSLSFYCLGYAIAFSSNPELNNSFFGTGSYVLTSDTDMVKCAHLFFQTTLASTSAAIVSGAMLERTRHRAYAVWTVVLVSFIYPIVAHWIWNRTGFLSIGNASPLLGKPVIDFAGAGVVHLVGGVCAIVGAYMVGPRHGFKSENDTNVNAHDDIHKEEGRTELSENENVPLLNGSNLKGYSIKLTGLGAIVLWFGFYGFNCGSALGVPGGGFKTTALIAMTTTGSSVSAGVAANVLVALYPLRFSVGDIINCVLTGLVAITASCDAVTPVLSMVIGTISVPVYFSMDYLIKQKLNIDDALSAGAVHAGGGFFGLIAAGLFCNSSSTTSLLYHGDIGQLSLQLFGAVLITIWSASTSFLFFYLIDQFIGLRVSTEVEDEGLDIELGEKPNSEMKKMHEKYLALNGLEAILEKHPHDHDEESTQILESFRAFLKKEFCDENLEFLLEFAMFRKSFHRLRGNDVELASAYERRLWRAAIEIANKFIRPESRYELNLAHKTRKTSLSIIDNVASIISRQSTNMSAYRRASDATADSMMTDTHTQSDAGDSVMTDTHTRSSWTAGIPPAQCALDILTTCYIETLYMLKHDAWRRFCRMLFKSNDRRVWKLISSTQGTTKPKIPMNAVVPHPPEKKALKSRNSWR